MDLLKDGGPFPGMRRDMHSTAHIPKEGLFMKRSLLGQAREDSADSLLQSTDADPRDGFQLRTKRAL